MALPKGILAKIQAYLEDHPESSTATEIGEGIGLTRQAVSNPLTAGVRDGTLIRRGKPHRYSYSLPASPNGQPSVRLQPTTSTAAGPSDLDAAIAALEIRRDALTDAIHVLKGLKQK
jgi:hypothetical protein